MPGRFVADQDVRDEHRALFVFGRNLDDLARLIDEVYGPRADYRRVSTMHQPNLASAEPPKFQEAPGTPDQGAAAVDPARFTLAVAQHQTLGLPQSGGNPQARPVLIGGCQIIGAAQDFSPEIESLAQVSLLCRNG